jgi:hypothetical protein
MQSAFSLARTSDTTFFMPASLWLTITDHHLIGITYMARARQPILGTPGCGERLLAHYGTEASA